MESILKYVRVIWEAEVSVRDFVTPGITAADFRADMAEKWQRMTVKNGGTLFGKTFIPFGKEGDIGDIGDKVMTNIIQ
jgi:hypothetical protein